MAITGSPGWSVTGGPWVEPKDGMKKYVWTETHIEGGKDFSGKLPQPSGATGPFQNVQVSTAGFLDGFIGEIPFFYQDAAVIAYRLPKNEKTLAELKPTVTSSGGTFKLADLADGNLTNSQFLPPKKKDEDIWIQYAFETPQTIKAFSVAGANHTPMESFEGGVKNRSVKVSDDGVTFREIATISGSIMPQNTVAIPPTTARYFRLVYKTIESGINIFALMAGGKPELPKPLGVDVAEFNLYTTDRIDQVALPKTW